MAQTEPNTKYASHLGCEVHIKWKQRFNPQTNRFDALPGLYCTKHKKHIKWLNVQHAYELINEYKIQEL